MPEDKADFLATALKRFEESAADEKLIREQALLDLRFVIGDQWEGNIKSQRIAAGRPALTFNRCHTFVQSVSNEARQNKSQIKFIQADGGDKDTAEVYEGLARHIQSTTEAKTAYETAVEYSAGGSFGYFRYLTDYCDDESWDQDLKVVPVYDPFSVYGILIPSCFGMEPQSAFVVEEIPTEQYKRDHPESEIHNMDIAGAGQLSKGWVGTETVKVAEYWYVETKKKELKRTNPEIGKEETRTVLSKKVCFCKINGLEIIEGTETEWPDYCIPIFPVLGKQIILDGAPNLFSVVRFQRDPQQVLNFYKTRIAETLATAPIQPYVVTEGQIKGHEKEWAELNTTMRPYLTVANTGFDGKPLPLPQRQVFEAPIASLSEAAAQEIDDMKATAGIFDASLGAKGNETSGKGILARQQQSNVTNMHFIDNLGRAFEKAGLPMARLIPKIYDSARMVKILGADETPKIVKINAQHQDANGKPYHYKIGGDDAGKYEIMVTMGRSFSTKKMESFDMVAQLLQGNPNLLPMIGDILFANSDTAGADQLSERFKKMLPPQLQDQNDGDPAAQAQQLQAKLAQTTQELQAIDALAKQLQEEKQAKVVEQQGKIQIAQAQESTKLEIVKLQEATKLAVAQITASKDANEAIAQRELETYKLLHDSAHDLALQKDQQAHEKEVAASAAASQSAQSAQEAGQQSAQSSQEADQQATQSQADQQAAESATLASR